MCAYEFKIFRAVEMKLKKIIVVFSPDFAYIFLQHLNNQQISDFFKKKLFVDVYAIIRITSRETRRRKKNEFNLSRTDLSY